MEVKAIRVSENRQSADDYSFILDGKRLYLDRTAADDPDLLTRKVIEELKTERNKNAVLRYKLKQIREMTG